MFNEYYLKQKFLAAQVFEGKLWKLLKILFKKIKNSTKICLVETVFGNLSDVLH